VIRRTQAVFGDEGNRSAFDEVNRTGLRKAPVERKIPTNMIRENSKLPVAWKPKFQKL
jgi:hypothetical protein